LAKKLAWSRTDCERRQLRDRLRYLLESGLLEDKCERERRQRKFPDEFRKVLIEKDGSIISRWISSEEAELLRYASSVPPITSIDDLSADEMNNLADIFEGWAQSEQTESVHGARLHGWADGLRCLAETVGLDYTPPAKIPGRPGFAVEVLGREDASVRSPKDSRGQPEITGARDHAVPLLAVGAHWDVGHQTQRDL
jgi:hypothetical protein